MVRADAMDTWLSLEYDHAHSLPDSVDELRTPDALVERFLREHTEPGDRVLDPFAGFGTTLAVAQRLDREPFGVEYEPERVAYVRERLDADGGRPGEDANGERSGANAAVERSEAIADERIREGSVLDVEADWFPACDYCFTSPPFMAEWMDSDPFRNYEGEVIVTWTGDGDPELEGTFGYGYDHSYCLVFSKDGE